MRSVFFSILVVLAVVSCDFFEEHPYKGAVARVGDEYLYKDDIKKILPKTYSKQDSILLVSNYINSWAIHRILKNRALQNISEEKKAELDALVENYRQQLYGRFYKEEILNQSTDTLVDALQLQDFYQKNKEVLKLNEDLIKLRYIQLNPKRNLSAKKWEERFKRYDNKDKHILDSISIHFISSFLNDSVWVKSHRVLERLPFLKDKMTKDQFIKYEDSTGLYWVKINDYLYRNQQAPADYVSSMLKQMILNQRKVEQESKFEKELIENAKKKNQFELYE